MSRNRQFRGRFTGGLEDVEEFKQMLLDSVDQSKWALTWDETKSFGDFGPLHKWTFGFTSKG